MQKWQTMKRREDSVQLLSVDFVCIRIATLELLDYIIQSLLQAFTDVSFQTSHGSPTVDGLSRLVGFIQSTVGLFTLTRRSFGSTFSSCE